MSTTKKTKQLIYTKGGYISNGGEVALKLLALERGIAISSLIGYAIDNELERVNSFQASYDIPDDEYVENAFADEAGKIVSFMRTHPIPLWLEKLALLRFDMGIPSKRRFLYGVRECIMKGMIVTFNTEDPDRTRPTEPYYRLKENETQKEKAKKVRRTREQKAFDQYMKLGKELKAKGLLDD